MIGKIYTKLCPKNKWGNALERPETHLHTRWQTQPGVCPVYEYSHESLLQTIETAGLTIQ